MTRSLHAFRYWLKLYGRTWRGTIVISVANPLLFLVGIGVGLGHIVNLSHTTHSATLDGVSYADFFAPGLLAASAMQTAFVECGGRVSLAAGWSGSYRAAATTPMEPGEIMAGHLLFAAFKLALTSAAFILVMELFGVIQGWRALAVWPAALLTGLAFAAPLAAWTVTVRTYGRINSLFRFVIMPMYMFSGTFFALSQLPNGIRLVAQVLPLAQGVDLCRSLSLGTASLPAALGHVAYLLVCVCAGIAVARVNYRRVLHG
ncbi:MAG TPA: ABC transporter permease [Solirubrobacteraceae bacterium]|jgi:lipooligosaccharide transport system permease protein|nr:ABC transporter permease [Solirubrobacteraceae bacterium]